VARPLPCVDCGDPVEQTGIGKRRSRCEDCVKVYRARRSRERKALRTGQAVALPRVKKPKPAPRRKPSRPRRGFSSVKCSRPGCEKLVPLFAVDCGEDRCSRECRIWDRPEAQRLCPSVSQGEAYDSFHRPRKA
jgi:hypothetical protein